MPKQIGIATEGGIKKYQAYTTEPENTYPTIADCQPGSTMRLIDATLHEITGYKEFDGEAWNKL